MSVRSIVPRRQIPAPSLLDTLGVLAVGFLGGFFWREVVHLIGRLI